MKNYASTRWESVLISNTFMRKKKKTKADIVCHEFFSVFFSSKPFYGSQIEKH